MILDLVGDGEAGQHANMLIFLMMLSVSPVDELTTTNLWCSAARSFERNTWIAEDGGYAGEGSPALALAPSLQRRMVGV